MSHFNYSPEELFDELNRQYDAIIDGGNVTKQSEALRYSISLISDINKKISLLKSSLNGMQKLNYTDYGYYNKKRIESIIQTLEDLIAQ